MTSPTNNDTFLNTMAQGEVEVYSAMDNSEDRIKKLLALTQFLLNANDLTIDPSEKNKKSLLANRRYKRMLENLFSMGD